MTMHFSDALASFPAVSTYDDVVENAMFDRPTLVLDVNRVEQQYHALKAGLGRADIHYAVKANPAREIIARLVAIGSHFDAASRGEIELVLGEGADPADVSFGNTIKRASDIAFAASVGVTLFAADAAEELNKIAENEPGAQVYIRLIVETSQADWPLSRKSTRDLHRWVYLSIGRFSGLAETEGEAIRYQITTPRNGDPVGPCVLAGPSCDSADVLYEKQPVLMPMTLKSGDRIVIRNCGAYTSSYSSVGFNGFPPLDVLVV